ncbi:hypothetical protein ACU4HD_15905 [Cupriavidus basilensis]
MGGTLKKPSVSPDIGVLALRAGGVVALALVAPVGAAILPLVDLSTADEAASAAGCWRKSASAPTAPPPGQAYHGTRARAAQARPASAPAPRPRPTR